MAEDDYRTLREVSVAMTGLKEKIGSHVNVATWFAGIILCVGGYIIYQGIEMSGTLNRLDERTISIQKEIASVQATLLNIQTHVVSPEKAALTAPIVDAFPGWVGTSAKGGEKEIIEALPRDAKDGAETWIFTPKQ
jgi:hypothetical protein